MADTTLAWMAEKADNERRARQHRARRKALRHTADGQIEWRVTVGPSGGFTGVGGAPLNRQIEVLIALWQLLDDGLICRDGQAVKVTPVGQQLLAWEESGGPRG